MVHVYVGGGRGRAAKGWWSRGILPALRRQRPGCRYNLFIKQFAEQVMRETQYICKHCQHRLDEDCGGKGGVERWWKSSGLSVGPFHLSEDDENGRGESPPSVIHRDRITARTEIRARSDVVLSSSSRLSRRCYHTSCFYFYWRHANIISFCKQPAIDVYVLLNIFILQLNIQFNCKDRQSFLRISRRILSCC